MAKKSRVTISTPDEFDILSGVWIFACNDENPIITFQSVRYRLRLDTDYPIEDLVYSRGDLFRRGVPNFKLDQWKERMRAGKSIPSWVKDIVDKRQKEEVIESLSREDVFRSQFRVKTDAPRSDLETIDWGLAHINRLRTASLEAKSQVSIRWQIWLVFGVAFLNFLVTLFAK